MLPLTSVAVPWPNIQKEENILIIPFETSRPDWHSVLVVNRDNGQKKWGCLECFASDVTVDNGILYAIRSDGVMAGYDLKTGRLQGIIKFAGGDKIDPLNNQYSIAAANGFVYLYFEDSKDSHELIALGPK